MRTQDVSIGGLTKHRRAVFEVISGSERHLTANEIFDRVRLKTPSISLATVYNSLRFLNSSGLIGKTASDGTTRFDRNISRHDHAICVDCGEMLDLDLPIPRSLLNDAVELSGFASCSIEVTLRGKCAKCR